MPQSTSQKTLKKAVTLEGIGLHSGKKARVKIHPGRPGSGIVFVRGDLSDSPAIPALASSVVSTQLATTLGIGNVTIATVEHLLAALQGLGVDNAWVEVDGPEMPILDGSSAPFCRAISEAGLVAQVKARTTLVLRRRVEVKLNEKWAVAEPCSRLEVQGTIDWDHPVVGFQEYHYVEGRTPFAELASARTFCFLRDVEAMKKKGLALGGSLENAIVVDEASVLNPEGLRGPDEFVRHKVLDALGDFKLLGYPLQAYVRLHRAGHDLHFQLMQAILKDSANYELVTSTSEAEAAQPTLGFAQASVMAGRRFASGY